MGGNEMLPGTVQMCNSKGNPTRGMSGYDITVEEISWNQTGLTRPRPSRLYKGKRNGPINSCALVSRTAMDLSLILAFKSHLPLVSFLSLLVFFFFDFAGKSPFKP